MTELLDIGSASHTAQALVGAYMYAFLSTMKPWIILAVALILTDLRFGIMAARRRGEEIRGSRMRRRTMNKVFDYGCWLCVAYACRDSVAVVLGVPVVSTAIVLYVYLNELASAMNNYCEYKGLKKRIDIFKLLAGRHALERSLEDAPEPKAEPDEPNQPTT